MPKDYSRQVDFTEEGQNELEYKLEKSGFRIEGHFIHNILDGSVQGRRPLGHIDPYNNRVMLHILAIKDNPLEEFVRNYDKLEIKPRVPSVRHRSKTK